MNHEIFVAGATGRTGRIIIQKLIHQGYTPHALVRDPAAARELLGDRVIYHQGDVREAKVLLQAMSGINAAISAIGTQIPVGKNCPKHVDYEGVANLVDAACQQKVERFILISSIAVTQPEHPLNCFGKVLTWKLEGEEHLRQSGLDYVIVRPGGLKDTPGGLRKLVFDQGDRLMGTISRADVAETCLYALQYPQPLCTTFEVIEADQKGKPDWENLFLSIAAGCIKEAT